MTDILTVHRHDSVRRDTTGLVVWSLVALALAAIGIAAPIVLFFAGSALVVALCYIVRVRDAVRRLSVKIRIEGAGPGGRLVIERPDGIERHDFAELTRIQRVDEERREDDAEAFQFHFGAERVDLGGEAGRVVLREARRRRPDLPVELFVSIRNERRTPYAAVRMR